MIIDKTSWTLKYIATVTPLQASHVLDGMEELNEMAENATKKKTPGGSKFDPKKMSSAKDMIEQLKQIPGTKIIRKKPKKRKPNGIRN